MLQSIIYHCLELLLASDFEISKFLKYLEFSFTSIAQYFFPSVPIFQLLGILLPLSPLHYLEFPRFPAVTTFRTFHYSFPLQISQYSEYTSSLILPVLPHLVYSAVLGVSPAAPFITLPPFEGRLILLQCYGIKLTAAITSKVQVCAVTKLQCRMVGMDARKLLQTFSNSSTYDRLSP